MSKGKSFTDAIMRRTKHKFIENEPNALLKALVTSLMFVGINPSDLSPSSYGLFLTTNRPFADEHTLSRDYPPNMCSRLVQLQMGDKRFFGPTQLE